jgi:hypothetical protein
MVEVMVSNLPRERNMLVFGPQFVQPKDSRPQALANILDIVISLL